MKKNHIDNRDPNPYFSTTFIVGNVEISRKIYC